MIDPAKVCLFVPPNLRKFKLNLFNRIAATITAAGGTVVRDTPALMDQLPEGTIPIIGCHPAFRPYVAKWRAAKRTWIYWDRGYLRRVFASGLPLGANGGYYRWHVNEFQMSRIRQVPGDRYAALLPGNKDDARPLVISPWHQGEHILVAPAGGTDYAELHGTGLDWASRTCVELRKYTDRPFIIRDKEEKLPLSEHLRNAHALVTHGSIAAVEAVFMGCPVFVHPVSAAAPMGLTDLALIEKPIYPERQEWLHSLAYHQFDEVELCNGTLWRWLGF